MENLIKQIRVKLTGAEEENKADLGDSRDQKIPIQNTLSFKEKKKAPNWFQRQFSRKMSDDYDSIEMEHATAVAAAAFAISSQEASEIPQKKRISEPPETSLTRTKSKMDGKNSPISQLSKKLSGSFKIMDDQDNNLPISSITEEKKPEKTITPAPSMKKTSTFSEMFKSTDDKKPETPAPSKTPSFGDKNLMNTDDIKLETPEPKVPPLVDQTVSLRSPPPPPPPPPPPSPPPPIRQTSTPVRPPSAREQILTRTSTRERKANVWKREEHEKIEERYEKLLETIDSWERRKKMKARRKLNKQEQKEDERKRAKALRKYQDKMKYIEEIAGGARAQANERRRNEELKAKEKANIIRTTGKLPGGCSCF